MDPSKDDVAIQVARAQSAAAESERVAGRALGRLRSVEDQLEAALLDQASWNEALASTRHELVLAQAAHRELDAIKNSRSWKLIWGVMTPYRAIRMWREGSST